MRTSHTTSTIVTLELDGQEAHQLKRALRLFLSDQTGLNPEELDIVTQTHDALATELLK